MGRIIERIRIAGRETSALFDSGSSTTYVHRELIPPGTPCQPVTPHTRYFGGRAVEVTQECHLRANVGGQEITLAAVPVDDIGVADKVQLGAVVGAPDMERWHIGLDLQKRRLDLTQTRKGEFTDF